MEVNRKLLWHPEAVDDLDEILHYCNDSFGFETARKVRRQILSDVDLLISQPNIGQVEPLLTGHGKLDYHALLVSHTKVIYTVHPQYIYIHLLWDTRRDIQNLVGSVLKR